MLASQRLIASRGALRGQIVLGSWERAASLEAAEARLRESAAKLDSAGEASPLARLGRDGGEPLPMVARIRMERLLGHDFSHVRVHTDLAAAQAAIALGARALAVGNHLYFGPGAFAPGTTDGDRLLLHELTHVVQHARGALAGRGGDGVEVSRPSDAVEQEATAMERLASEPAPDAEPALGSNAAAPLVAMAPPAGVIARQPGRGADLSTSTLLSMILDRLGGLIAQAPALEILRRQVQQDRDQPPANAARLRHYAEHLSDELVAAEPALASLATLEKPDNYLPTISAKVVHQATLIEGQFVAALMAAYSDIDEPSQLLASAQNALRGFADFVIEQTLGPDGIQRQIAQVMSLREEVKTARGMTGRAIITRPADTMAGFAQPSRLGGLEKQLRLALDNIRSAHQRGEDVGRKLRDLIEDTRGITTLISALAAYEQFIYWSQKLEDSVMGRGEPRVLAHRYRDQLDAILRGFERAQTAGAADQYAQIVQAAAAQFDALVRDPAFTKACQGIQGRLGTIATVHLIEKIIVITAAAAVTGGMAAEAAAGMAGELGLGATAAGAAGFGAEVFAFTMVSRAGEGAIGAPSQNSVGKDLAINAVTLGVLKAVNRVFARLLARTANPSTFAKVGSKIGNAATVVAILQGLAEAQYLHDHHGSAMPGGMRAQTAAQSAVMLAALELGRFIVKLPAARGLGGIEARLGAQLQALGGERAAVAQQLGALEAGTLPEAQVTELLAKIQDLYARELQLLDTAAKQGVSAPALHQAIAAYQTQIALVELKLTKAGVATAQTGPQLFRQVRPGVVAYQPGGRAVLDLMYGGALVAGERPGELVGTLPSGEKTFFLTEEAAGKEQHVREGERHGEAARDEEARRREEEHQRLRERLGQIVGPDAAKHLVKLPAHALEAIGRWDSSAVSSLGKLFQSSSSEVQRLAGDAANHADIPGMDSWIKLASRQLGSPEQLVDLQTSLDKAIQLRIADPSVAMEVNYYQGKRVTRDQLNTARQDPGFDRKQHKNIDIESSSERWEMKRVNPEILDDDKFIRQIAAGGQKFTDIGIPSKANGGPKMNIVDVDFGDKVKIPNFGEPNARARLQSYIDANPGVRQTVDRFVLHLQLAGSPIDVVVDVAGGTP